MTWRQIKPELFPFKEQSKLTQAIITLEQFDDNSQSNGRKAHIIIDNSCYILCMISQNVLRGRDNSIALQSSQTIFCPTFWWSWEAVQALRDLPHPDVISDGVLIQSTETEITRTFLK